MSDQPQNNAIPQFVEPRKFAQKRVDLSGVIPADKLERLGAEVSAITRVEVNLAFDVDDQHRKVITGKVDASLVRQCQRCLEPLDTTVHSDVKLVLVWDDEQAKHLSDGEPWIVEEESADLYGILEEEILLNMPYLAYHSHMCVDESSLSSGEVVDVATEKTPNPFEQLKVLKDLKAPKDKK